jgi:hypothetical protein
MRFEGTVKLKQAVLFAKRHACGVLLYPPLFGTRSDIDILGFVGRDLDYFAVPVVSAQHYFHAERQLLPTNN